MAIAKEQESASALTQLVGSQPLAERVLPALAAEGFETVADWALLDAGMEATVLEKLRQDAGLNLAQVARWKVALRAATDSAGEAAFELSGVQKGHEHDDFEPTPSASAASLGGYILALLRADPASLRTFLFWPMFWDGQFIMALVLCCRSSRTTTPRSVEIKARDLEAPSATTSRA